MIHSLFTNILHTKFIQHYHLQATIICAYKNGGNTRLSICDVQASNSEQAATHSAVATQLPTVIMPEI